MIGEKSSPCILILILIATQSCPTLCNPWTVACQAPVSMEFSRQEYWSGLPFSSPGDLPHPGIKPRSPVLQADSLPSEPLGETKTPLHLTVACLSHSQATKFCCWLLGGHGYSCQAGSLEISSSLFTIPPISILSDRSPRASAIERKQLKKKRKRGRKEKATLQPWWFDCLFSKNTYLAVPGVSCVMWDMQDFQLQPLGSSSLTRDQTQAPCIRNVESQPLHHQGSPHACLLHLGHRSK